LAGVLLALALVGAAQDAPAPINTARAISQGDCGIVVEYGDAGRMQLEAAIATIKTALGVPANLDEENEQAVGAFPVDPSQKDLVVKLAEGYFTLGAVFVGGSGDEAAAYRKGKHWGLKALRMDAGFAATERADGFLAAVKQETRVPELYWACLNWASLANFDRLAAVTSGVVKKTITMLEHVAELDAAYDCYGAYRVLGSMWGALPWSPFGIYRRDLDKARAYLCHVIASPELCGDLCPCPVDPICDEYLGNRRVFAEFYLMEKVLWAEAAEVLRSILDAPIGDVFPLFNARAKDDARRLLAEVDKHL